MESCLSHRLVSAHLLATINSNRLTSQHIGPYLDIHSREFTKSFKSILVLAIRTTSLLPVRHRVSRSLVTPQRLSVWRSSIVGRTPYWGSKSKQSRPSIGAMDLLSSGSS